MMGGGELKQQSSSVMQQQMMWSGTDSKNMMSSLTMPCADQEQGASTSKMPPLSSSMLLQVPSSTTGLLDPREVVNGTPASLASSDLHDGQESSMPESWMSQLLLIEGLVGDHERYSVATTALLSKGLQEEGPVPRAAAAYNFYGGHGGEEIRTNKSQAAVSQMLLASSPRSCITTSLGSNMLDFSNSTAAPAPELRNHQSDNSSESNSNATGSAPKKARVQTSSSAQSTLKVRKERLGDRITALHQIVSPFGKTDTASVLQETIGYIRFLLSQIEALSYPYLSHAAGAGNGDDSILQHQQTLLLTINHSATTIDAAEQQDDAGNGNKEDLLRSRGLCLVPVSCASHLLADDDDDNAAGAGAASDFWAAPPPPPPPPLGGIIWR